MDVSKSSTPAPQPPKGLASLNNKGCSRKYFDFLLVSETGKRSNVDNCVAMITRPRASLGGGVCVAHSVMN